MIWEDVNIRCGCINDSAGVNSMNNFLTGWSTQENLAFGKNGDLQCVHSLFMATSLLHGPVAPHAPISQVGGTILERIEAGDDNVRQKEKPIWARAFLVELTKEPSCKYFAQQSPGRVDALA